MVWQIITFHQRLPRNSKSTPMITLWIMYHACSWKTSSAALLNLKELFWVERDCQRIMNWSNATTKFRWSLAPPVLTQTMPKRDRLQQLATTIKATSTISNHSSTMLVTSTIWVTVTHMQMEPKTLLMRRDNWVMVWNISEHRNRHSFLRNRESKSIRTGRAACMPTRSKVWSN